MNRLKTYFILSAILLAGCVVKAQKFTASVNKNKVAVGEVLQLVFSLNGSGGNFIPPSLGDFNIYSGPNPSNNMQWINGTMSQSISFSYYLIPKKEGTFTIGAASIMAGNNKLQSNPITIEVIKGSGTPSAQSQNNGNNQQSSTQNLFARTSANKSKIYVGEQLVVTHKVYTRLDLRGFQDVTFPAYSGFWTQELGRTTQYDLTQENIDGIQYSVVEIKRVFLFAQRSGKIQIEPMDIQCIVREHGKRSNSFFGNTYRDVLANVKSNTLTIEVLPLPESGKPADFPGAVGNFSVNTVIDKDNVKTNDGINLKITVTGKGNLKLIDAPKINFPDEFESYDPKSSENIAVTANGVSGSKTFEYLLIPRREGTYTIQAADFNYFDAEKKTYITLPSKEFTITVEKGEGNSSQAAVISSVVKEDVKLVSNDIRYIKIENISLDKKGEYFFGSAPFVAAFSLSPLLFFVFLFLRREHIKRNSNLVLVKNRNANKIAKKQLALAERSMKAGDKESFFVNVLTALYSYIGNKMNIPVAEMSKEKAVNSFREINVSQGSIDEFVTLLDECEFARYAPGLQSGNLQDVYTRAENIITKIEDEIA